MNKIVHVVWNFCFGLCCIALFSLEANVLAMSAQKPESVTLAREGKALLPIATASTNATPAEQTAAKELAEYLGKITGAKFEVMEEQALPSGTAAIFLGNTRFAERQGIDISKLGEEESILKTAGGSLIITGGRPRGTLYAVYIFLEDVLGCHWYMPWYEKIPGIPVCKISRLDKRVNPYFMFRGQYTHVDDRFFTISKEEKKMFLVRNRMNEQVAAGLQGLLDEAVGGGVVYGGRVGGGHGFFWYLPAEKYFKDHPEYYSLRGGKRVPSTGGDGNHVCLSNPDVLKIMIDEVKKDITADIKKGKNALCYTVSVNDGGCSTICDCPQCRIIAKQYGASDESGTDAGLMLWFVNQVADAIKDQYPGKYIRTLAYIPTTKAPKNIRAKDNVLVHICAGPRSEAVWLPMGTNSFELANVKEWSKCADHIWLWDYAVRTTQRPAFFCPLMWKMDEQFKFFKSLGTISGMWQENEIMAFEDTFFRQFYEMNMWIYMKLCQNPDLDVNALASEFIMDYYGKAGPDVLSYLELIRSRLPGFPYRTFDFEFMSKSQGLFDQAKLAVKDNPELLGRVKDLRIQLDMAGLAWRNNIISDYLAKGGKLEQYPWRISTLKTRLLDTLNASQHIYIQGKTHREKQGDIPILDIVKRYINEVSAGVDYSPLPKELAGLPPERVIDLTAPLFTKCFSPMLVPDKDAALGLAVPRMNTNECPMYFGYYSYMQGQKKSGLKTIGAKDVPGKGYHLYQGPRFSLDEWIVVYLTRSWQIARMLYTLYDPANPKQEWDSYVSMKYTGPAYPYGTTNEPDALYIDRIILVKVKE